MDCPKYTNLFSMASNDKGKEVTMNFFQEYPVAEETDGQVVVSTQRAHVCGVTMSRELAEQMYNILGIHLEKGEDK